MEICLIDLGSLLWFWFFFFALYNVNNLDFLYNLRRILRRNSASQLKEVCPLAIITVTCFNSRYFLWAIAQLESGSQWGWRTVTWKCSMLPSQTSISSICTRAVCCHSSLPTVVSKPSVLFCQPESCLLTSCWRFLSQALQFINMSLKTTTSLYMPTSPMPCSFLAFNHFVLVIV